MEKLWYYGNDKNMVDYKKFANLIYNRKKYGYIPKQFEKYKPLRTLIYYGKTMVQRKKLWYYEKKNYGAMEKTMILYRKLWNFVIL